MKKNNWVAAGMALLSLTLVFAAFGDISPGSSASKILVIGPATSPVAQTPSIGANNGRVPYKLDGILYEVSAAATSTAVSSGMAYAADNYSYAYSNKACFSVDSKRGPPHHKGEIV